MGLADGVFSSRGQVTVFIIIGIILVFAFAGILYVTQNVSESQLETQETILTSSVPQAFAPVQFYTENCLEQIAKRGLLILGEQGGYINPDLIGDFSLSDPTEHDGIYLEPLKVPYWHYNQNPNQANEMAFASLRPGMTIKDNPELSIEAQLSRYVREEINGCLENYDPFRTQGFTFSDVAVNDVDVRILPQEVLFSMDLPLEAAIGDSEGRFDHFVVRVPLQLQRYYTLAQNITLTEQEFGYLENIGLNLVQIYSGVDRDRLPPTTATTFDETSFIFWQTNNVEEKFKQMLVSNVPLIRYFSADNYFRYEYPVSDLSGLYQRTSDDMIIPLGGAEGLEVRFDYFNWDIFLDINEGEKSIEPAEYKFKSPLPVIPFSFSIQNYYNTYDFSYPVLVSITDPEALNGEGYTFNFAMEANVVNNRVAKADKVEPAAVSLASSLVCNDNQRDTEIIRTLVVDSENGDPLELVRLGFQVPQQDFCAIGQTDSSGVLEASYPAVFGGVIDFEREGYLTNFYPINTYEYKEQPGIIGYAALTGQSPVIEMHRIKTINATIKQKSLEKCVDRNCPTRGFFDGADALISYKPDLVNERHSWSFSNAARDLDPEETGVLTLRRIRDTNPSVIQDDFASAVSVTGNQEVEIQLVPGVYEVTGLVSRDESLFVPEDERCTGGILEAISCGDSDGCCYPIDPVEIPQFVTGQVSWDTEKSYLVITPEQLYGSKEITFYILTYNIYDVPENLRIIEDLQVMGNLTSVSKELRSLLEPRYS